MVATAEKKTTTTAKKKPAVKKTEAATKVARPAKAPKAEATKGGKLVVVQTGSVTGISPRLKATLQGLGLGKPRARRELEDTPAVRGMIRKVRHLVCVEGEAA